MHKSLSGEKRLPAGSFADRSPPPGDGEGGARRLLRRTLPTQVRQRRLPRMLLFFAAALPTRSCRGTNHYRLTGTHLPEPILLIFE